ncbi:YbaY family lipoprotein [Archangium violaceum]|uniref:YbaY family lipoprotein n=1 Tax=Archangium violaceum TaxID=83451 RepID=UPI00193B9C91|nr:YbaY family lipoprotein [Archangium violaceum]QRK10856.1 YbaY family lipoprotein [Archangium violaceum]
MTRPLTLLVGCLTALTLAACATTQRVAQEDTPTDPAEAPAEAPTGAPATPPAETPAEAPAETQVTGSVTYRERIALTPDAVVQVEVVESSPGEGSETVVGEQTLQSPGQVPIRFSVTVPSERIRPGATYVVRARITDAGRVYTTPTPVPVLTQGHSSQDVTVRVRVGG